MSQLVKDVFQFIKRKYLVQSRYRKLKRKESKLNQHMILLGKQFKELNLESDMATEALEIINELNQSISQLHGNIEGFRKDENQEIQVLQELKDKYNNETKAFEEQIKSIETSSHPIQLKKQGLEKDIKSLTKKLKKLENDQSNNNKKILKIQTNPEKIVDPDKEIASIEANNRQLDQEMGDLKDQQDIANEELKKAITEKTPFEEDIRKVKNDILATKKEWDKTAEQFNKKHSGLMTSIEEENSKIEGLETDKILPYRELGKVVLEGDVSHEDLESLYQKVQKTKTDIEELKKNIAQNEEILRQPNFKKVKRILLAIVIIILLIALIVGILIFSPTGPINEPIPTGP
ncbi:MAG TPA: hypothetical protein ENI73_00455 [Spirochaetes bacterium]|nr:hypothetical protein [Spirochaetota bacterium]